MGTRKSLAAVILGLALALPASAGARVLRVGTYHRIAGQYRSIQTAVNAARPGDWVLIAPGDYKTSSSSAPSYAQDSPAAVLIQTPRVYLRGMNRNQVVIDGTTRGSRCNSLKADQSFGPAGDDGAAPKGLNGVMVWQANHVSVENLTTCNFLGGSGDAGNGVWWNGGDNSGKIGGRGYYGGYLTTTSTYYDPSNSSTAAEYGIFSSNWDGGTWHQAYASNFNDSGFYIGACQQSCNQTVDHIWAEYNALGYSGSNSGGSLVVENSEFDNNEDGFDTNSQNGDNPPPQNGACPHNGISPVTHTHSCWVFIHNYSHDNNNPNIPSAGLAAAGPVGTGISISGGRNDTVMDNRFSNNDAWGTIFVPFPDSGPPCTGGTNAGGQACVYDESGDALIGNTYSHNGGYGNETNGDFALTNTEPGPTDCFARNVDTSGHLTATPSGAEQTYPSCNGQTVAPSDSNPQSSLFLEEVACDSTLYLPLAGKAPCLPTDHYPRRTTVTMHPLPSGLPTMPNPCSGVGTPDPWCQGQVLHASRCVGSRVGMRLKLSPLERFISATIKIGKGKAVKHKLRGSNRVLHIRLGRFQGSKRVRVSERIQVASHRESIRYTEVYARCHAS
jgi:hypothetical protein